jgi:hypothetical protein
MERASDSASQLSCPPPSRKPLGLQPSGGSPSYFTIMPLDLPGFHKDIPGLNPVTMKGFCSYIEKATCELDLEQYIVCGISFSFSVICQANLDKRCKGILAISPYIDRRSLRFQWSRNALVSLMQLVCFIKIYDLVWYSTYFDRRIAKALPPESCSKTLKAHYDSRTFFEVANICFTTKKEMTLHHLPHALIINDQDDTINSPYVISMFQRQVPELLIVDSGIDHYPADNTCTYFQSHFEPEKLEKIVDFFIATNQPVPTPKPIPEKSLYSTA